MKIQEVAPKIVKSIFCMLDNNYSKNKIIKEISNSYNLPEKYVSNAYIVCKKEWLKPVEARVVKYNSTAKERIDAWYKKELQILKQKYEVKLEKLRILGEL